MDILRALETYAPFNEQEERDRREILRAMAAHEDIFLRSCMLMHMTVYPPRQHPENERGAPVSEGAPRSTSLVAEQATC